MGFGGANSNSYSSEMTIRRVIFNVARFRTEPGMFANMLRTVFGAKCQDLESSATLKCGSHS
jgi:hypothetical protein